MKTQIKMAIFVIFKTMTKSTQKKINEKSLTKALGDMRNILEESKEREIKYELQSTREEVSAS